MRTFLRENSLTLAFGTAFVLAIAAQAAVGHAEFNNGLVADELAPIAFGAYLMSSDFAVDVTENWQSEYLQFFPELAVRVPRGRVDGDPLRLPAPTRFTRVQTCRRFT